MDHSTQEKPMAIQPARNHHETTFWPAPTGQPHVLIVDLAHMPQTHLWWQLLLNCSFHLCPLLLFRDALEHRHNATCVVTTPMACEATFLKQFVFPHLCHLWILHPSNMLDTSNVGFQSQNSLKKKSPSWNQRQGPAPSCAWKEFFFWWVGLVVNVNGNVLVPFLCIVPAFQLGPKSDGCRFRWFRLEPFRWQQLRWFFYVSRHAAKSPREKAHNWSSSNFVMDMNGSEILMKLVLEFFNGCFPA